MAGLLLGGADAAGFAGTGIDSKSDDDGWQCPRYAVALGNAVRAQHRVRCASADSAVPACTRLVGSGISALLSAALMIGVVPTLLAGPLGDRGGRKTAFVRLRSGPGLAGVAACLPHSRGSFAEAPLGGGLSLNLLDTGQQSALRQRGERISSDLDIAPVPARLKARLKGG